MLGFGIANETFKRPKKFIAVCISVRKNCFDVFQCEKRPKCLSQAKCLGLHRSGYHIKSFLASIHFEILNNFGLVSNGTVFKRINEFQNRINDNRA